MVAKKVKKIRNGPMIVKSTMDGKTKYFLLNPKFKTSQSGYTLRTSSGNMKTFKTAKEAEAAYKRR